MKLIYKPIGITPNELRLRLIDNNELSIKSCFAGRLDPMARGKMIFIENIVLIFSLTLAPLKVFPFL